MNKIDVFISSWQSFDNTLIPDTLISWVIDRFCCNREIVNLSILSVHESAPIGEYNCHNRSETIQICKKYQVTQLPFVVLHKIDGIHSMSPKDLQKLFETIYGGSEESVDSAAEFEKATAAYEDFKLPEAILW